MNKKTVLQIYAAAVCFFSAAAGIILLINMTRDVLSFAAPEFFMRGEVFGAHQTDAAFAKWYARENRRWGAEDAAPKLPENKEELTAMREESFAAHVAAEKHDAAGGFVRSLISALLCAALFWPHWRLQQAHEKSHVS